jgi:hypothetical protein
MRLINCTTATPRLETVLEDPVPRYVILSHTWGRDEATFQDIQDIDSQDMCAMRLNGREFSYPAAPKFQKLVNSCMWAFRHDYKYLWIDTCCIDKTSSAELQEAINTMYRWYQHSQVCLAYLADVEDEQWFYTNKSRWFSRGWTLQELLAPKKLVFLTKDWVDLGTLTKERVELGTESELGKRLSDLSEIDLEILRGTRSVRSASLAQRMSWAAGRQTTRKEDRAYSLLGIFDVSMPMLYGEGDKAFLRLQEEILKSSDDQSLLAWSGTPSKFGVLADSPDKFADNGSRYLVPDQILERHITVPTSLTNKGLRIELICWRGGVGLSEASGQRGRRWAALLECKRTDDGCYPIIVLEKTGGANDRFLRVNPGTPHAEDGGVVDQHKDQLFLAYQEFIYGKNP